MKRDILLFLKDILEYIELIEEFTKNKTKNDLMSDLMLKLALERCFGVIGEAAKNIPLEMRTKYQNVPWKDIAGMRDILSHAYFSIDIKRLWDAVAFDVPKLKHQIQQILKELEK